MEDKTFDLLSKIYGELTEFKTDTAKRFNGIDKRLDGIEGRLTKIESSIENEIKPNINASLEGYQTV